MENEKYSETPTCVGTPADAMEFVRYVADLACRITAGEAHPDSVNWRYIRDRAASAIRNSEVRP